MPDSALHADTRHSHHRRHAVADGACLRLILGGTVGGALVVCSVVMSAALLVRVWLVVLRAQRPERAMQNGSASSGAHRCEPRRARQAGKFASPLLALLPCTSGRAIDL